MHASSQKQVRRDLVEDDVDEGASAPLPVLADDEWALLLDVPAFRMATSMKYTQARKVSGSRRSTASIGAAAAVASGGVTACDDDASAEADDDSDDGAGSVESDAGEAESSISGDVDEERKCSTASVSDELALDDALGRMPGSGSQSRRSRRATSESLLSMGSLEVAALRDARAGLHFAVLNECNTAPMPSKLRAEVCVCSSLQLHLDCAPPVHDLLW